MTAVSPVDWKLLSFRLQSPPEVAEIVDLAIVDDDVAGYRIHHGLRASRREIKDRQPAMGE